jgi:hypothetical protein
MSSEKHIGLDVHQATISVAVLDSKGKLIMESMLETKAATILEFLAGLRGTVSVTFEEGTWAAWLYDVLKPHVDKLVVCNPRSLQLARLFAKIQDVNEHMFGSGLPISLTWQKMAIGQKSPSGGPFRSLNRLIRSARIHKFIDLLSVCHIPVINGC